MREQNTPMIPRTFGIDFNFIRRCASGLRPRD
jgi:hypothetical protein